jgi:NitT/TauT family transport system permease protein
MRGWLNRVLPPLLPIMLVTALFEGLIRGGVVPSYLIPMPSEVFHALFADRGELFGAALMTAEAALAGLVLSFLSGVSIAILLSLSDFARRALYPYAVFFQTVPIISVAPLLVIWFGYGLPTVIASAFIVSVFPVIASTLLGLQSVDPSLLDLFRLYSANRGVILFKLRLPFALPQIFAGLRIASGLAVIGAIVGEFIAGGGLGGVVDVARTLQRIDKVFAAVLVSSALGLILIVLIDAASRLSLRHWHASERNKT